MLNTSDTPNIPNSYNDLLSCEKLYTECSQKYNSNLNECCNCFLLYNRCKKYLKT